MRQTKSGKQMDDALIDIVADESLLVKTAVAKILADIQKNLGEPGFDISEEALSEVIDYSDKINSLATLKTFIQQISSEPGYEKIAAYLSSAVKPISQGTEGYVRDGIVISVPLTFSYINAKNKAFDWLSTVTTYGAPV
jgi:hypothetical protein